jgi:hypothetical protein
MKTLGETFDLSGMNRLLIRLIEHPLPEPKPGQNAYDFHSLVWENRTDGVWSERVVITREDFEQGGRQRWVCALHSFDSVAGNAIIKVGEKQPSDDMDSAKMEYTWQEWDLINNQEVRVFRVCAKPFEPFE